MKSSARVFQKIGIPEWVAIAGTSVLLGLGWFLLLYDRYSLYFTHVSWIYAFGRDPLQHQLGWEFFRHEPWSFPLGTIKQYGTPIGTSVTFLDSIPLFAFFFKILSPLLEKNFQYFGLWELTSVIMQILSGMLIMREFTQSYLLKILGASLLVLSPVMIFRAYGHNSFSAHWILLLAIYFIILEYRHRPVCWLWIMLFALAMLIQLYFVPMLIPLWLIWMVFRYRNEKRKWTLILEPLKVAGAILLIGFCAGLFTLKMNILSAGGYGTYSWNLGGFFNPIGFSKYIKSIPIAETQEEGFSYLGLGYALVVLIGFILFWVKDSARNQWKFFLPIILASAVYTLYALSNKAMFYNTVLWEIQLPEPLLHVLDLFRSSGRFIWPVFYFMILFGMLALVRNIPSVITVPIFAAAIILQFFDLQPLYTPKKVSGFGDYSTGGLNSEFWEHAWKVNERIIIIPTEYYESLALYAVHHDLTISSGYFGRADVNAMETFASDIWDGLLAGESDPKTIYVLSDQQHMDEAGAELIESLYICEIDQYDVLFSRDNQITETDFDFESVCAVPGT